MGRGLIIQSLSLYTKNTGYNFATHSITQSTPHFPIQKLGNHSQYRIIEAPFTITTAYHTIKLHLLGNMAHIATESKLHAPPRTPPMSVAQVPNHHRRDLAKRRQISGTAQAKTARCNTNNNTARVCIENTHTSNRSCTMKPPEQSTPNTFPGKAFSTHD